LAALLCGGQLWPTVLPAQAASNDLALTPSNSPAAHQPAAPPLPPGLLLPGQATKPPLTFFRELLAMSAAERKQALTNRSPESQKSILDKVREYQLLKPDERELRLQVTELHYYLLPLMTAPATNRAARLAGLPSGQRQLVEDRLQEWDKLAPAEQKRLLENQATVQYLTEIESLTAEQRRKMLNSISPARRATLEKGIARWDEMSAEQRQLMLGRFNHFFELTPEEKEKALRTLSDPERRQIQKTLKAYERLQPSQRAACIRALGKFTSLSLAERQQFLKNAERWQAMTPAERQAWRDVVRTIPPPLPNVMPPLPPVIPHPRPAAAIVTNGGG
jgi:Protein of unknown function (DUF3106)